MQKLNRMKERISRSAFFFGAVLFHLVLFLMLVGLVVWQAPPKEPDQGPGRVAIEPQPPAPKQPINTSAAESAAAASLEPIKLPDLVAGDPAGTPKSLDFGKRTDLNPGNSPSTGSAAAIRPNLSDKNHQNSDMPVDLQQFKKILGSYDVPGRPGFMKFPIYIGKYADGDWDCNIYMHDGLPASGSLPNLMAKIHDWSHGELDGRSIKVVALDSPEILTNPPPFIFLTGHKDFNLTKAEIENLKQYLLMGGAIWGDSAYAGDGSRFDVAFHREMKYVLPDADLQFQDMPMDHDVFTPKSHFRIDNIPPGMNRRADPLQCINLGGKLAILYTPNDYSDMMTMLLQPGLSEREAQMDGWNHWEPNHPLYTNNFFVWHQASFFRNYQPNSSMSAYKLSMNVLIYLLHRYDDELDLTN